MKLRKGEKALRPVRPNCGIEAAYRRKLYRLIDEMARSYAYWIKAAWRKNEPVLAQDATPAADLQREVRRLSKAWQDRFDEGAPELARWFSLSASRRSDAALKAILKKAGFTVKFKTTRAVRDVLDASIAENVSLIKSIASQYHTEVEGMVMRSVQAGRDLGSLTKDLQKRYGVTRRRAALIARDQNNKATAVITRVRQVDLEITEAIWQHSHAGKKPRKTHLANDGKRYNPAVGWFDPDPKVRQRIWPGMLGSCRCTSRPVVKGFT